MHFPCLTRIGAVLLSFRWRPADAFVLLAVLSMALPVSSALEPPSFSPAGGLVRSPAQVQVTHANDSGTVFYTIDGSDPRDPLGMVAADARTLSEPLSVNRSLTIRARVRSGTEWSGLSVAAFTADQDFSKLFFSELMYHPKDAGDAAEFIELKNTGAVPLDLSGLRLRTLENPNLFTFPAGSQIAPGAFVVLVALEAAFRTIHPIAPFHGIYSGSLDNFADDITLERNGAIAARVSYHTYPPWQVIPDNHGYFPGDGVGFSLVRTTFDPHSPPTDHRPWRASTHRFGSPGEDDPPSPVLPIYVNELLTRGSLGVLDFVEFYNPNSVDVDLGGWWLSDERDAPYRYKIPAGTVVPRLGFLLLDESQFGASLAFSAEGDGCYLFSGDTAGNLTGYSHGFEVAGSERDISFGRFLASDGTEDFPPQLSSTPGAANSGPRLSPLVISEIMYQPASPQAAYIELHNTTNAPLALWDPTTPSSTWAIGRHRRIPLSLPQNITVPAGGYLLIVAGDPAAVRATYAVPDDVQIIRLANAFADLAEMSELFLFQPAGLNAGQTRYATAEFVTFRRSTPWPAGANAPGHSLERINPASFPNDPLNWRESPSIATPGRPNSENLPPRVWAGGDHTHFTGREATLRGAVADDRWSGSSPTSTWMQLSGPVIAEFTAPTLESVTVRFPAPGQYVIRLTASDESHSASDTATITVIDSPFDAWRSASFDPAELADDAISHSLADPDHDALPNFGEYLFASPPKEPSVAPHLNITISADRLQATWRQRAQTPDVVITPERADRLEGPWFSGWEFFDRTETSLSGLLEITIRDKLPLTGRAQGFIRLRYSLR